MTTEDYSAGVEIPQTSGLGDEPRFEVAPVGDARLGWGVGATFLAFALGLGGGYVVWGQPAVTEPAALVAAAPEPTAHELRMAEIHPSGGVGIPVSYGDIGPRLLASGAIDPNLFAAVYDRAGTPLTAAQKVILTRGSDDQVVFSAENARFLQNLFWAVGLANRNEVLLSGPMQQYTADDPRGVGRLAAVGGWTLGAKEGVEIFAAQDIISLSVEQQARLMAVVPLVYRPCCNNPTSFPDCNHGMAMLGMLQMMAASGATEDEMFAAAKVANSWWFPQQAGDVAALFLAKAERPYADISPRAFVGPNLFSGSGNKAVRQWLSQNGLLQAPPAAGGGSCGAELAPQSPGGATSCGV